MSEVEVFAGCLKEDGIDVMFAMEGAPLGSETIVPVCRVNKVCPYKA